MFGRATIRLGIGPHSSFYIFLVCIALSYIKVVLVDKTTYLYVNMASSCRECCMKMSFFSISIFVTSRTV